MKLTDESFRGRVVLSSDGVAIGEIVHLIVDPAGWCVRSLEVRLRKDAAERVGVPRSLFHGATLEISTDLVQSAGDAVILSVPADELRQPPPPPPAQTTPAPP
jgi:sporulation protein YlmC with PRC-barrel domain